MFEVKVHNNLKATAIIGNTEWAAQQSWVSEIARAPLKTNAAYQYNHAHNASSIKAILKIMDAADDTRDCRQAKSPEEMVEAVLQGMTRLQHLVNNPPETEVNSDWSYRPSQYESAYASKNILSPLGEEATTPHPLLITLAFPVA